MRRAPSTQSTLNWISWKQCHCPGLGLRSASLNYVQRARVVKNFIWQGGAQAVVPEDYNERQALQGEFKRPMHLLTLQYCIIGDIEKDFCLTKTFAGVCGTQMHMLSLTSSFSCGTKLSKPTRRLVSCKTVCWDHVQSFLPMRTVASKTKDNIYGVP